MSENYWKDAYKGKWGDSSAREQRLMAYIQKCTGKEVKPYGLGAGSTQYISGSAARNGYQKGDADLYIEDMDIFIEVTGPLSNKVDASQPLWFRPDKLNNAARNINRGHDTFLAHHCTAADLWRIIHVDDDFVKRFRAYEFPVVNPVINGRKERYVEIETEDICIRELEYLIDYIREQDK